MDIRVAAAETKELIEECPSLEYTANIFIEDSSICKMHLHHMCNKIIKGEVTGEKAHRWLGWVQACIRFGRGATLEELKLINRRA